MIASPLWRGKRYAVLGLARSGVASVRALLSGNASVVAWDADAAKRAALEGAGVTFADPEAIDLAGFDGLVVSPGVPLNRHSVAARARAAGVPILGDIELFAQARATLPAHKVVGITGTNGKSTTTALVHHILQTAGMPTRMGGNIGLPILGQEPLPDGGVYVLELSSYQIDLTHSLDCDVAVIGIGDTASAEIARSLSARAADVTEIAPGKAIDQSRWPSLQGPHNAQNALAAIAACAALGVSDAAVAAGLASFTGLPHRMERVGERSGVVFVNDSKATNPESVAPALAAFDRVHWIVGGKAKGADLDACRPQFGHVVRAYTIGEAAPVFAALLGADMPVEEAGTLAVALASAARQAQPGDTVLLSPACASFDQFRDFEQRGDTFRALVESLV
jgi:UDP-N-acetylmuramoylalanine--D-glutamate ligase